MIYLHMGRKDPGRRTRCCVSQEVEGKGDCDQRMVHSFFCHRTFPIGVKSRYGHRYIEENENKGHCMENIKEY